MYNQQSLHHQTSNLTITWPRIPRSWNGGGGVERNLLDIENIDNIAHTNTANTIQNITKFKEIINLI